MKGMVQAETDVESVLQWERDWFRRASMGELARREGREATTAGASRLYMNEREFKTKLRDLAANAVRQSIKLRLSDSAVLDVGRTVASRVHDYLRRLSPEQLREVDIGLAPISRESPPDWITVEAQRRLAPGSNRKPARPKRHHV
jgi:hypothetical protein